ncbi:MAG: radical SAM protein [Gemmatimonas sp. SG8_38_2]|nr:MAG: radical SAM protein [Gemmatimonas sp. SG8_38_2]
MKYVFGPVPSRRLGQSLGVDPVPLKTCNWNCVYCQLGRSRPVVNERKDYFPPEEVVADVKEALDRHGSGRIDWVTFVGSGEPLLHAHLGWMLREVKAVSDVPIALITNGSLLYLPDVREEVAVADAVLPTLDAGTPELYRRIDRPHPEATFERLMSGLIAFSEEYDGKLWVETMLLTGLNDTDEALRDIAARLKEIQPDEVHLNLPTRPPAEAWLEPVDSGESLMRAIGIIEEVAPVRAVTPLADGNIDLSAYDNPIDAIVGVITRHPLREDEVVEALDRWAAGEIKAGLKKLEASGRAQVVIRYGTRFWTAAPSFFPDGGEPERSNERS